MSLSCSDPFSSELLHNQFMNVRKLSCDLTFIFTSLPRFAWIFCAAFALLNFKQAGMFCKKHSAYHHLEIWNCVHNDADISGLFHTEVENLQDKLNFHFQGSIFHEPYGPRVTAFIKGYQL